jgi:hypothetical protein
MAPSLIRSLGTTLPFLPSAVPGIICGNARQTLACAAVLRNRRRFRPILSLHIFDLLLSKNLWAIDITLLIGPFFSYPGTDILKFQSIPAPVKRVYQLDIFNRGSLFITNTTGHTPGKYNWKSDPVQKDSVATDSTPAGDEM